MTEYLRIASLGDPLGIPSFDPPAEVAAAATCNYCKALRPATELFRPIPGGAVYRCRDTAACQRREVESLYLTP